MTSTPAPFTTRPTLEGTVGMAASTHWAASATAMGVLERGGTAFDAAVAAAFVLHVVEPHLNGPGGDLVAIFTTADDSTPRVLDGQGPAPAAASATHYRGQGLDRVPGAGALAAAIPGAFDAWLLLLRDHGTWEFADVVAPAIGYARHGFPAVEGIGATIRTVADLFRDYWPDSAALWMPDGSPPRPGQVLRNPAWAHTLERLAAAAKGPSREARVDAVRSMWTEGFVAEAIEEFCAVPHRHSSGTDHAGVLTGADLAGFTAQITDATIGEFRGYRIAKSPPWGQGPALLTMLAILDGFDDADLDPSTERGAHLVLEAIKLAHADREAWYGDTGALDVTELLDPRYVAERRALIDEEAVLDLRPGSPGGRVPRIADLANVHVDYGHVTAGVGEPTVTLDGEVRGDTCHVDVVDRWGNLVSATPSGGWLQSSPVIPSLGFALGTRLQMTWLQEGLASTLMPGRRPRTTLTPTLVLRDEHPIIALGSPGGDQQDQWQLLYLLRTLVGGATPQEAIDAPAFHSTSAPSSFWPRHRDPGGVVVEDRLGEDVITALDRRDTGLPGPATGPWAACPRWVGTWSAPASCGARPILVACRAMPSAAEAVWAVCIFAGYGPRKCTQLVGSARTTTMDSAAA